MCYTWLRSNYEPPLSFATKGDDGVYSFKMALRASDYLPTFDEREDFGKSDTLRPVTPLCIPVLLSPSTLAEQCRTPSDGFQTKHRSNQALDISRAADVLKLRIACR